MGNMNAYRKGDQTTETAQQSEHTNNTTTSSAVSVTSTPMPTPIVSKKHPSYVHPFIDMINRNCTESEMINTLEAFCGRTMVGVDDDGRIVYETVDQTEFIAPVLQVFSYCATHGKSSVVQWLLKNFVPLQVSYDNNFCYFECLKWGNNHIADMIAEHESFYPSMEVLENLLSRGRYTQFRKCMSSPYLKDDLNTYRFTFMHYIDNVQFSDASRLLSDIKQKMAGQNVQISDMVYPNPKLVKLMKEAAQTEPVYEIKEMGEVTDIEIVEPQQNSQNTDSVIIVDAGITDPTDASASPVQVQDGDAGNISQ